MLMVDRVIDYSNDWLHAVKAVSVNEPAFQGHFPHLPILPGVFLLEAMVQASAIMASLSFGAKADDNRVYLFAGVDKARFKRPVYPGDYVEIETRVIRRMRVSSRSQSIWKTAAEAKVENEVVCSAQMMFTFREL